MKFEVFMVKIHIVTFLAVTSYKVDAAAVQVVNHQLLTMYPQLQSPDSPSGIYGETK
jgi:hypothetical protein